MESLVNVSKKIIYYVSNLGADKVSIIDGNSYSVIKEVEVGSRPQDIVVDEKNNVYIATDRNSKVTLIDHLYNTNKTWSMPNNGSIKLDSISQKIYVCNTEEICIYNISSGEILGRITGFIAADSMELDKSRKKLFVLDIFQNEIKVYDTTDFKLIKEYKEVGNTPSYIFMGENERYLYISNKGLNRGSYSGNISILDLETGKISYINFQEGSSIIDLDGNENFLYAANNGLHRIEVIDIINKKCIASISTTLPELQRIRLSPDEKLLLVTSKNSEGKGVLDRIDISKNVILDTFIFDEKNIVPYDIGIVIENKKIEEKNYISMNSNDKLQYENGSTILARKVLSTYKEKINFTKVCMEVSLKDDESLRIEDIIFENCNVIEESKSRKILESKEKYLILEYDFYIPYYIKCKNQNEEKYIIEGKLKGKQKARLYVSDYKEGNGVEYVVKSLTKLISSPIKKDNLITFDVSSIISTHAIIEDLVVIPFCNRCMEFKGDISYE
ncbi:YncE family protein [Clostridium sp. D46t1_190503_E9]|uniref:YncE family protein n=1 Tax=Clostridium sp. D46t1_190503_E9 TaxID=2787137 RepID=UPI00325FB7FB